MRVEAHALAAYRHGDEQPAARLDDASQLSRCVPAAMRIDWIAVPSQSDMLDHMQARYRSEGAIRKRQTRQVAAYRAQPRQRDLQRPVVDEDHRELRA